MKILHLAATSAIASVQIFDFLDHFLDYEQPLLFSQSVKREAKKMSMRKFGTREAEVKREKMRDYPLSHSI